MAAKKEDEVTKYREKDGDDLLKLVSIILNNYNEDFIKEVKIETILGSLTVKREELRNNIYGSKRVLSVIHRAQRKKNSAKKR